ncbi:uncharacterized protein TM35_000021260 [Trypanosoma theileri]|uniref:Uncharacterized protein n=1 Tax=Trypanosoma theileri TaxID=67003 RepID=A0A1X0P8N3_9TRYP|nr:uncharacterized protein TM35_000021260 [Trypanosoma theileri]ORC92800.1 hypothetical protein TM35_000021260 [Trypanosoma theileri]
MWNRSRQLSLVCPLNFSVLRCSMRRKIISAVSTTTTTTPSSEMATSYPSSRVGINMYGAKGYDFVDAFYAMGPNAALGRLKANLSLYGILGFTALTVVVYFFTTRSYTLSTCPYPVSDARYQVFSSNYAVLRNRWNGKERVVEVFNNDGDSAIVTKRISVNWLIYSVRLYLHATESIVVVDVGPELSINRFVTGENRWLSSTSTTTNFPSQSGTSKKEENGSDMQIVFHTTIRPLAVRNSYQKGTLPIYERTLESVVRELLTEHYRKTILLQAEPGLSSTVTEELLQNGQLKGKNLSGMKVIGNPDEFADEVQQRVQKKMGDQVILLQCSMTVL